jgi:S1-C subfamily serine protease
MNLYELPKFEPPKLVGIQLKAPRFLKNKTFQLVVLVIFISSVCGFIAGAVSGGYLYFEVKDYLSKFASELPQKTNEKEYVPQTSQEQLIIKAVEDVSPAVVSIVITKDVPIIEQYYYNPFQEFEQFFGGDFQLEIPQYQQQETEKQEIGGGSGFIVSEDGMILTNKHVVLDTEAEYTVFTNDGKKYPAKVLARDPVQDLAIIKIDQEKTVNNEGGFTLKSFPTVKLGDSDEIKIGQTVIAIGNALGEFRNTVSVGVVSGLSRSITASGGGLSETLEDVIQTDTAINKGNSGGPLLNLKGEVIGINSAMVEQAQSIGFALPINKAKKDIEQVKTLNKIVYPFLGIRYVVINEQIKEENKLSVDYGAWIIKGEEGESAVEPGSAAEKAGLKENDIILEFNNEKITTDNSLAKIIQKYDPGDKVVLKVFRDNEEKLISAVLGERSE